MPVGQIIALLAEEGDGISNLEIPKQPLPPPTKTENTNTSSQQRPSVSATQPTQPIQPSAEHHSQSILEHSRPLFPSVHRLLLEHNINNMDKIRGTGVRGMITKGDVLTFLGKASGPLGTFKFGPSPIEEALQSGAKNAVPQAVSPKVRVRYPDWLCF